MQISHGTSSIRVASQGFSDQFFQNFRLCLFYPIGCPWVSENGLITWQFKLENHNQAALSRAFIGDTKECLPCWFAFAAKKYIWYMMISWIAGRQAKKLPRSQVSLLPIPMEWEIEG